MTRSLALLRRPTALLLGMALLVAAAPQRAQGQQLAKYGADFLAGGVGARAIGLSGAYTGLARDVTAGYWNAAGLSQMDYPEIGYMHVERFGGVVSFDYAGAAFPVGGRSTFGVMAVRSGVNDIVNTLNAYNPDTGQPDPAYQAQVTRFSAADYLFGFGYARRVSERLSVGGTGKVTRRSIGDFADAWGYSVDAGVQYRARGAFARGDRLMLGLQVQDALPYVQSWSVAPGAFAVDCLDDDGEPYDACLDENGELMPR